MSTHTTDGNAGAEAVPALTELARAIAALAGLPPISRATRAAELADEAKAVLAKIRRAAIYEATRSMSWEDAAAELGVSTAMVNKLVTQHRASRIAIDDVREGARSSVWDQVEQTEADS